MCLKDRQLFPFDQTLSHSKHLKDGKIWDHWQHSFSVVLTYSEWATRAMIEVRDAKVQGGMYTDQEVLEQCRRNVENSTWSSGDYV